jgi:hypothetical protein
MSLKLEVGKIYYTKEGVAVAIIDKGKGAFGEVTLYRDQHRTAYFEDGQRLGHSRDSALNLTGNPDYALKSSSEIRGTKHDDGKPPLALIPRTALVEEALAFLDGKRKYGQWNYLKGLEAVQLVSAVQRHITAWLEGEERASDSGVHHLGHARAGLAMLMNLQKTGKLIDDRYKGDQDDRHKKDTGEGSG